MKNPRNDPTDGRGRWKRPKNRIDLRGDHAVVFIRRKGSADLEMLVDIADLHVIESLPGRVSAFWDDESQTYYAVATVPDDNGRHRRINVHRLIAQAPEDLEVDHWNHNGLDNRRSTNLRVVTGDENKFNRRGAMRNNRSSGFRGVSRQNNKWRARVRRNKKGVELGLFHSPELAAVAVAQYLRSHGLPA